MTANDLYKMTPETVGHSLTELVGFRYNHIKEADLDECFIHQIGNIPDVEVRIIHNQYIDFRRYWQIASVWYKGEPVMIIQNAGREGDDHAARFITNVETFNRMIAYIKSLELKQCVDSNDIIDADVDDPDLTHFYNDSLERLQTLCYK